MGHYRDSVKNDTEAERRGYREERWETHGGYAVARYIAGKDLLDDLGNYCAAFDHGSSGITWYLHARRRGDPNNSDLRSRGDRDQVYPTV